MNRVIEAVEIGMRIDQEVLIGKIKQGGLDREIETEKLISRVNRNLHLLIIVEIGIVEIEDE